MLPACLFTFKQKKSGFALREEKQSFKKGWNLRAWMVQNRLLSLLLFSVVSGFNRECWTTNNISRS